MATFKSRALVMRTLKYSESSMIIDLLTESKGLRSFIVSGVRGSKSKNKASYFQHLNMIDIVAYDRSDGKLGRIQEYTLTHHYGSLTTHIVKSNLGLFVLEVTRNAIKETEENISLFDFVWSSLLHIDNTSVSELGNYPITYILGLSSLLGIYPLDNYHEDVRAYFDLSAGHYCSELLPATVLSRDVSFDLHRVLSSADAQKPLPKLGRADRNRLLDELLRYYQVQLPQFPELKSLPIIRAVL